MKQIIVNGFSLATKKGYGIERNAFELLKALDQIIPKNAIAILIPYESSNDLSFSNIEVIRYPRKTPPPKKHVWGQILFPRYVKQSDAVGIDLTLSLPGKHCDVIEIYDCIAEQYPDSAKSLKEKVGRLSYILRVKRSLKNCKTIITCSNYSKQNLCEYYSIPESKIQVIPCAWEHYERFSADDSILVKLGLSKDKYFFSLGSRFKYKNFKWVLEAARENPSYTYVVTGSSDLSSSDRDLEDSKPENLIFTGYIGDSEVKGLMKNCRAYLQPSLSEGFGIPPMEAMSTGARCILSNAGSLPEVYGNSVWYIDPYKYEDIDMDMIMSKQIDPNDNVLAKYSWKRSASMLWDILQEMASA